jgi:hypothetical protein
MKHSSAGWERFVRARFDLLLDHGYAFDGVDGSSPWETSAIYRSPQHAVLVKNSLEFMRAEVELVRLVAGRMPPPGIWIAKDTELARTLLDNVVEARASERMSDLRVAAGRSDAELGAMLDLCAKLLVEVAPDFLEGSDQPFTDAARVINARIERDPQKLTVWLPADASVEREGAAVAEARLTAPAEVEVIVRRYPAPGGPPES